MRLLSLTGFGSFVSSAAQPLAEPALRARCAVGAVGAACAVLVHACRLVARAA